MQVKDLIKLLTELPQDAIVKAIGTRKLDSYARYGDKPDIVLRVLEKEHISVSDWSNIESVKHCLPENEWVAVVIDANRGENQ